MSSPLPPDPYAALGVAKDAEFSAIRSAYRKLALLHHPDRIKDEALREKGKDEFQKIQRAWELLGDAEKRQRYDDRVRLAELRKESMMRDSPQRAASTANYSTRPTPAPAAHTPHATNAREYREDGNFFEEVRQPRHVPTYDESYAYDEPSRSSSRKYPEYEKRAPAPKTEKKSKTTTSFAAAGLAAQFASTLRSKAAEKSKSSKAEEKKSDREKKRERTEKVQTRRTAYVDDYSSDSDYTEVRPSMRPSSRSKTTSDYPRTTSSKSEKTRDLDEESFDGKWERHHDDTKAYISKASNRPGMERSGSDAYQYWAGGETKGRKSGSDSEKRPSSSKGRRTQEDYFTPSFSKSTSSPSNLRAHVEERAPPRSTVGVSRDRDRERDRDRGRDKDREHERDREHRKVIPPLSRSHTTPMPRSSSKKDSAPPKGSNLKHSEAHVHDSSYSSSSSPQTPEMREQSPPRTSKGRYASTTSTKYQIVDPEIVDDEGGRGPRITKIYPDAERYARYHSPEPISRDAYARETDRRSRDKPERPKVDTGSRSKSSRGASMMADVAAGGVPPIRRGDSGHHTDSRASPRSPRDTPPLSRHDSGRNKLFMEVPPEDRYNRSYSGEKVNIAPRRDPSTAKYAEMREAEYSSRFPEPIRVRRPSVY